MKIGIYPGSFDPITLGHMDIIERSTKIVDELYIAILVNSKKNPLFSVEERVKMLEKIYQSDAHIHIVSYDGLLVTYAKEHGINVIIRGLRAMTDFEYELQIAQTNRVMEPSVDTIFLTTNLKYAYLSSTVVKEVASYGGDISPFVTDNIKEEIIEQFSKGDRHGK